MTGSFFDGIKIKHTALIILRVLIGWHFLYEGVLKLSNSEWTSANYLSQSEWILSGLFEWIASNPAVLQMVDIFNIAALIFIGLALVLGIFTKSACYTGIFLLLLYYAAYPPFIGFDSPFPAEGSYLIVNKILIEAAALWVLALYNTSRIIGLERLLKKSTTQNTKY